jgi:hypothetical protein
MAIIAKTSGESMYDPAPEGLRRCVCADVIDQGIVEGFQGKPTHKVTIVWQTEDVNPKTGERYQVRNKYTLSLHEKSNLSQHLEAWRGKKFTAEERKDGFDLEKLIGANCQIQVVHEESKSNPGRFYAAIQSIMAPRPDDPEIEVDNYTRYTGGSDANSGQDRPAF